ncbi:MAG: TraR/DksA family transcriptional regulator [Bacteroidota bacterium]
MAKKEEPVRYSDEDLAEFETLIAKKISMTEEQLSSLKAQIIEISENTGDEHGGDWVDDSSVNNDIEMLNNMAIRQQKYLQDLNNAMLRIKNKVYGMCVVTGELIDKRRLLAVPTTTKSLSAKTDARRQEAKRMTHRITDNPYVKQQVDRKK